VCGLHIFSEMKGDNGKCYIPIEAEFTRAGREYFF